jgi:hypothetical protein
MQCKAFVIRVHPALCNERAVITGKVMIVLQDCMDSLKDAPGSYSEACHDGNEVINIKGEVKGVQEEEVPVLSTFPVTKTQCEVSCMSVCVCVCVSVCVYIYIVRPISQVFTYLLCGATVLVELWPPHEFCVRFRDSKFLQDGVVRPTPNPQPGGPGYLS